jgi:hypothetical protein
MQSTERRSPGPASRRCFIQSSSSRRSRPPGRLHQGAMASCLCRRGPQGPACPSAIHWTLEAFVLECHELVGFDQSLAVYSRTRPGCAYRDRRRTELSSCQQPLLVCVACRHRAWGELSGKVRLMAPDASLHRVACVLACKRPSRGFHAIGGDQRGAHRFGHGTDRFAAGCTKVGLDLPRPPRIGLAVRAQVAG